MPFIPKKGYDGKTERVQVAAQTFTKGDALVDNGSGYLSRAAAGEGVDVKYVAAETISTAATQGDYLLCWRTDGVLFEADTDAAPARTDVGTVADLASASQVDPDASTDDIFYIQDIVGATSNNKVIGYFQPGVPNA